MNKIKSTKGITLISLVITIIILLILAGVTIATLMGNNGLINKAKDASITTDVVETKEQIQLELMGKYNEDSTYTNGDVIVAVKKITGNDIEEGVETITTKKGNTVNIADLWIGNSSNGTDVEDLFDESGIEDAKLHIGDFINYSAGEWRSSDMTTIANTGVIPNNSTNNPSTSYQFGGFTVGSSRSENATPYSTSYNYVQDKATNSAITGWRLFDVNNGVMTLISAGCPEDYYHPNETNSAYISEYILTGNESLKTTYPSLGLGTTYKARNWDMYINRDYNATSASILTKAKLDEWYSKYITASANTYTNTTFQKIYKTSSDCVRDGMYESLIDNYSYYWLSSAHRSNDVYDVNPSSESVGDSYTHAFGVRILVSLSSNVKLSEEAVGTKTVVSRSNEYTYNVWNLITQ